MQMPNFILIYSYGLACAQLVVNSIIATDISDKNLSAQRKERWNKAFHEDADKFRDESVRTKTDEELQQEATNRKATIVIEHLIQASDVAHTMQHWRKSSIDLCLLDCAHN